jgi:hypothetical protein
MEYFIHVDEFLVYITRIFLVVQEMKLTSSLLKLTCSCVNDVIIDETPTKFCMKDAWIVKLDS